MLYRLLNLSFWAALAACLLGLVLEPVHERPAILGLALLLCAFRYVVSFRRLS